MDSCNEMNKYGNKIKQLLAIFILLQHSFYFILYVWNAQITKLNKYLRTSVSEVPQPARHPLVTRIVELVATLRLF